MRRAKVIAAALLGLLAVLYAAAWTVPLPARLEEPGSPVVLWRDGSTAHVSLSPDEKWRVPVDLDRVNPAYPEALVALEDSRFWLHPGVDPIAIARAVVGNLAAGHRQSGASTITMQLVRVLEPRPRTIRSKAIEAVRAMQLELRMSKREILEAYLTFVPYGRNVEGIEAASLAYFGHSADALTPAEIATLLAVPQDPNDRYPTPRHEAALQAARDEIAGRLLAAEALPTDQPGASLTAEQVLEQVKATPVPRELAPMPRRAPHAADWLWRRAGRPLRLQTTLDRGAQGLAERTLGASRSDNDAKGIHNASIVVVEHGSGDVVALIGNYDFWDAAHGGQIAGFDVARSPGSALKPFIYARAIDQGLVLPDHLVRDIPIHYGGYSPENFDGTFSGVVRMEDALSRSLNIPFVELLGQVGVEPFLGDLRTMGAAHLNPTPGWYGLSLAAGGSELTPLEMAGLYATLARGGTPVTLRFQPGAVEPGPQVLSPGAAWLTRRALSLRDRPDFPARRQFSRLSPRIHWKTGTSFGYRDAWAIGSGSTYTVAVWMGNFDNTGTVHLVGAEAAGPVLFDLLEALGEARSDVPDPAPGELVEVEVCALSGHLPGDACPQRKRVLAREEKVPTARCSLHQRVTIDEASGLAVTPACRGDRDVREETYVVWPSAVRRWLADQWRGQASPPSLAPDCDAHDADPPVIVAPQPGQVVLLIPGMPADRQEIPLEGDASDPDAILSWFVDGAFLGKAAADERIWWTPSRGDHEVVVMDEAGLTARSTLRVQGR